MSTAEKRFVTLRLFIAVIVMPVLGVADAGIVEWVKFLWEEKTGIAFVYLVWSGFALVAMHALAILAFFFPRKAVG